MGILILPAAPQAQPGARQRMFQSPTSRRQIEQLIQEGRPIKCGMPVLMSAMAEGVAAGQMAFLQRPSVTTDTHLSPSGEFLIHYATAGVHAVSGVDTTGGPNGVPDFIEVAAAALDSVRTGFSALGWRTPIDDGNGTYDVYFADLETLYGVPVFGFTQPDSPTSPGPPATSASFIELDNDYLPESLFGHPPLESLRVTIAHEYHHAIQMAYNLPFTVGEVEAYRWFAELSATYHEEVFYDGINDYYFYLPSFLGSPHESLTDSSNPFSLHMYGAVLWALFLDQSRSPDSNRELWTRMADDAIRPLIAHQRVAVGWGTTLLELYRVFSIWQLYTAARALPGQFFEEGAQYPSVLILTQGQLPLDLTLPSLAFRYYRTDPASATGGVAVRISPFANSEWGVGVAGETAGTQLAGVSTSVASTGTASLGVGVELFDWDSYDSVIHWSLTGVHTQSNPLATRTVEVGLAQSDRLSTSALGSSGFKLMQNYPNPFRPEQSARTFFVFSLADTADVTIEVRSLGGASLWRHRFNDLGAGVHFSADLGVGWDGRDEAGVLAPSGVYLIVGRSSATTRATKMTIIR
jgi:hypothetical protein